MVEDSIKYSTYIQKIYIFISRVLLELCISDYLRFYRRFFRRLIDASKNQRGMLRQQKRKSLCNCAGNYFLANKVRIETNVASWG